LKRTIVIEHGIVPRVKTCDQAVIDVLLLADVLSIRQHQAAEFFLDQCSKADVFLHSQSFDSMIVSSSPNRGSKTYYFPYAYTIKMIKEKLSPDHSQTLHKVVVEDIYPGDKLPMLRESLNLISNSRLTLRGRRAA